MIIILLFDLISYLAFLACLCSADFFSVVFPTEGLHASREPLRLFGRRQSKLLLQRRLEMKHVVHRSLPWLESLKHRPWTSYSRSVATQASIQDVEQSKKKATNRQHWQPHEVSVLIAAKKKQLESEAAGFSSSGKSKEQWEEIEAFCQNNGIGRNAQQCRDKWQRLLRVYSKVDDWEKNRSPDKLSFWQMKLDERKAEGLQFGLDQETFDALKELHSNVCGTKPGVEEFAESKGTQGIVSNVGEVQQLEEVAQNFTPGILEHGDKETDGQAFEELEDTVLSEKDHGTPEDRIKTINAEETCNGQLDIIETRTEVTDTTGVSTSVSQDVKCIERTLEGEGDVAVAEIPHGDMLGKSIENGSTSHILDGLENAFQHATENSPNVLIGTEERLTHALSSPQVHHGEAESLLIPTTTTGDQLEFCKDANFLSGMEIDSERSCDGNSAIATNEETVRDRTTQQHSEDITGGFLKGEIDRSTEIQEIVLDECKMEGKKIMSMAKDLRDYISSVEEIQGRPHNDQHYESLAGVWSDRQAFEGEECIRAASGDDVKLLCKETESGETIGKVVNGIEVPEISNLSKESKGSILCTGGIDGSHEESQSQSNSQRDVSHISKVVSIGSEDGVVKHDLGSTKLFGVESPWMGGEINIEEESEKPFKDLRGVCKSFGKGETTTANQSQKGDANADLDVHTNSLKGGQIKKVTHHRSELDDDLFTLVQAYFRNFIRNVSQAIAKIFKF